MNGMYSYVCQETTLLQAWSKVKQNKGAGGVDGQTIASFERQLGKHIRELSRTLTNKTYRPLPVRRVFIPKANGKLRPLGIPAVRDRVVQQAVRMVIEPSIDRTMSDDSYGFRPHKSAGQAIAAIKAHLAEGYTHVVDADINDFFGTINQQTLMNKVRAAVSDRDITALIYQFLTAGVMEEGKVRNQHTGTPQGGVISPLLANLYLDEFDTKLARSGAKLVRYADDFVLLAKTAGKARFAYNIAKDVLAKLDLSFAEAKTRITTIDEGFDFLGYTFWKSFIYPSDKSMKKFKEKVRIATRRQQPKNILMVVEKLNPILRGWGNYFTVFQGKSRMMVLDTWIRMRLRSFVEKRHTLSLAAHTKYPISFFVDMGLVSLSDMLALRQSQRGLSL
jgi:group II intron reverse transcriptase/maturase